MHIADGIIDARICMAANVVSLAAVYVAGRKTPTEEIPKMGVVGAALFVVSLIHIPVAGTALHPGLYGLAGIILGKRSFPVIFTVLLFQALIFQHGGLITLGVNALNMGAGAWLGWLIWQKIPANIAIRAFVAGFAAVLLPALLMGIEFRLTGYGLGIFYIFSIYVLLALAEGVFTLSVVQFFRKVKSNIINLSS